ncbi:contact-dependent growth inhibition system immunity protein [Roseivirga seohaensis]|uniref:contact-dependent growth inhibition system immunity protein n=1 Tax=Roseivirga seohaensis TaxID=1914963 RepID=UPI003BA92EFF
MKSTKTKLENNWKTKALENLEKDYWADPTHESQLVKSCHRLRKKPLKDFETEDLRIMIGQNIGLNYLMPLALDVLKDDIFVEGDLCAGDILKAVLTSDIEYWSVERDAFTKLQEVISENKTLLVEKSHESLDHFDKLSNSINF